MSREKEKLKLAGAERLAVKAIGALDDMLNPDTNEYKQYFVGIVVIPIQGQPLSINVFNIPGNDAAELLHGVAARIERNVDVETSVGPAGRDH